MNKAIVVEDLESLIKRGRFAVIFQFVKPKKIAAEHHNKSIKALLIFDHSFF